MKKFYGLNLVLSLGEGGSVAMVRCQKRYLKRFVVKKRLRLRTTAVDNLMIKTKTTILLVRKKVLKGNKIFRTFALTGTPTRIK